MAGLPEATVRIQLQLSTDELRLVVQQAELLGESRQSMLRRIVREWSERLDSDDE